MALPLHSFPPFCASCSLVLFAILIPAPQEEEQSEKLPQASHIQSTLAGFNLMIRVVVVDSSVVVEVVVVVVVDSVVMIGSLIVGSVIGSVISFSVVEVLEASTVHINLYYINNLYMVF